MMRTKNVSAGVCSKPACAAQATIFLLAVVVALLASTVAFAQGGSATGDLRIGVKDPAGNIVADATVTVRDEAKKSSSLYGTFGWPETYVIDRNGVIRRKFIGAVDWGSPEITDYLSKL